MRVRMKTYLAGPSGSASPGDVIEVPADDGAAMVQGGYADPVAEAKVETAEAPVAENAALRTGKPRK